MNVPKALGIQSICLQYLGVEKEKDNDFSKNYIFVGMHSWYKHTGNLKPKLYKNINAHTKLTKVKYQNTLKQLVVNNCISVLYNTYTCTILYTSCSLGPQKLEKP